MHFHADSLPPRGSEPLPTYKSGYTGDITHRWLIRSNAIQTAALPRNAIVSHSQAIPTLTKEQMETEFEVADKAWRTQTLPQYSRQNTQHPLEKPCTNYLAQYHMKQRDHAKNLGYLMTEVGKQGYDPNSWDDYDPQRPANITCLPSNTKEIVDDKHMVTLMTSSNRCNGYCYRGNGGCVMDSSHELSGRLFF